jgi:hypothetical protein
MSYWQQQHPWMNPNVMGMPQNNAWAMGMNNTNAQMLTPTFGMDGQGGPIQKMMSPGMSGPPSPIMSPDMMAQMQQQQFTGEFAPNAPMNAGMNHGQMGSTGTPQLSGAQGFGFAMQGLQALGNLWGMIQQNKIAKAQLALQREAYETNMNNTIKTYNTALEDRINARYAMEGRQDQAGGYMDRHRLSRSQPA